MINIFSALVLKIPPPNPASLKLSPLPGGHAVAQLVEALRYKSESRGFNSRWCQWIFYQHNPSSRTMAVGLTQSLTEMSTRNISWWLRRPVLRDDNLTTFMSRLSWNLWISATWNPLDLYRPVMGLLFLTPFQHLMVQVFHLLGFATNFDLNLFPQCMLLVPFISTTEI
jgi:hypothetical protein